MAKRWPALDVRGIEDSDMLLAALDDCSPTALEERESGVRIFFATAEARDAAIATIGSDATLEGSRYTESRSTEWRRPSGLRVEPVDVSDEDWAQRSQENLAPITVDRITIVSNLQSATLQSAIRNPKSAISHPSPITLLIPPSTAFGTGYHATTRLCLTALQMLDLTNAFVLDVGTGSGILAIASVALGARQALGIDNDPDAIAAARENLLHNPHIRNVEFMQGDLRGFEYGDSDVLAANLTGALLLAAATALAHAVRPGGHLIVSGFLAEESGAVVRAFGQNVKKVRQLEEDGWIGATLVKK